jgi:hypothetical protein
MSTGILLEVIKNTQVRENVAIDPLDLAIFAFVNGPSVHRLLTCLKLLMRPLPSSQHYLTLKAEGGR